MRLSLTTVIATLFQCIAVLLTIIVSYRRQGGLRSEYFKLVGVIVFNDLMTALVLGTERVLFYLFDLWLHVPIIANVVESIFYFFAIPNFVLVLALAVQRFLFILKPLTAKGVSIGYLENTNLQFNFAALDAVHFDVVHCDGVRCCNAVCYHVLVPAKHDRERIAEQPTHKHSSADLLHRRRRILHRRVGQRLDDTPRSAFSLRAQHRRGGAFV